MPDKKGLQPASEPSRQTVPLPSHLLTQILKPKKLLTTCMIFKAIMKWQWKVVAFSSQRIRGKTYQTGKHEEQKSKQESLVAVIIISFQQPNSNDLIFLKFLWKELVGLTGGAQESHLSCYLLWPNVIHPYCLHGSMGSTSHCTFEVEFGHAPAGGSLGIAGRYTNLGGKHSWVPPTSSVILADHLISLISR